VKLKVSTPLLVFVVYFTTTTLFRWQWSLSLVWFWLGGALGMLFIYLDRLIYIYWTRPHEQLSEHLRHLLESKRFRESLTLIDQRQAEQRQLVSKSVLFMAAWAAASLFIITSAASLLATGFVLGIGLRLFLDIVKDIRHLLRLKDWLFWPIKRAVTLEETKIVVVVFFAVFLFFTLLVI